MLQPLLAFHLHTIRLISAFTRLQTTQRALQKRGARESREGAPNPLRKALDYTTFFIVEFWGRPLFRQSDERSSLVKLLQLQAGV